MALGCLQAAATPSYSGKKKNAVKRIPLPPPLPKGTIFVRNSSAQNAILLIQKIGLCDILSPSTQSIHSTFTIPPLLLRYRIESFDCIYETNSQPPLAIDSTNFSLIDPHFVAVVATSL